MKNFLIALAAVTMAAPVPALAADNHVLIGRDDDPTVAVLPADNDGDGAILVVVDMRDPSYCGYGRVIERRRDQLMKKADTIARRVEGQGLRADVSVLTYDQQIVRPNSTGRGLDLTLRC